MSGSDDTSRGLNVEQVLRLHNLTKDVAKLCEKQLRAYLDALAPLFRPRRVLGEFVEGSGREGAVGAAQHFAELKQLFQKACGRPVDLRHDLTTPLESMSTELQIHPWEYQQDVSANNTRRKIAIRSPLTWVVSYPSPYSLPMFRQVLSGGQERDPNHVAVFVLRACVMSLLFEKLPALKALFEGLRYSVEIRKFPEFGDVPLTTISAPFRSFRPSDEVVSLASGVSGGNAFEEVLDLDAVRSMSDPLRELIKGIVQNHGQKL